MARSVLRSFAAALVVAVFFLPEPGYGQDNAPTLAIPAEIEDFANAVLAPDSKPSIDDYHKYFGFSDLNELVLVWQQCDDPGRAAPLRDPTCYDSILRHWSNRKESPSFYLAWLRQQLPTAPKITIKAIHAAGKVGAAPRGQRVTALLGDTEVVFWLPANPDNDVSFGKLSVLEIDGFPVDAQHHLGGRSVLMAMGLKTLIQPQTMEEIAAQQSKNVERCSKDPACAKRRAATEKSHADQDALRERSQKNYDVWCKDHSTECQ